MEALFVFRGKYARERPDLPLRIIIITPHFMFLFCIGSKANFR